MALPLLGFVLMLLLVWLEEDEENTNDKHVQDTNNNSGLLSLVAIQMQGETR
jgi:hypothetical protein